MCYNDRRNEGGIAMSKPVLLVMAAGMGSRYGGLKQMDPMTAEGELIIDFSLYDAWMAGFSKAIFVIRKELEKEFRKLLAPRAGKYLEIEFVYQEQSDLPGVSHPERMERSKPWGTAHAIMSARNRITGPFAVINADDYYGPSAFPMMYDFLSREERRDGTYPFAMVGYRVENTLTEHGTVARGQCFVDQDGNLSNIVERLQIKRDGGRVVYLEENGMTWTPIPADTPVSMNLWGYTRDMMDELVARFPAFYEEARQGDLAKAEYQIPGVTDQLIREKKATVKVLASPDRWYGVTYQEDKATVAGALQSMKDKGLYPEKLWK